MMTSKRRIQSCQLSLAVLLSACSQESFLLGALAYDAGPIAELDGSSEPLLDSATPNDSGPGVLPSPVSVSLEARGRDDVIAISLGCGAECVTVRANVAGGVPPYRITWDDGKEGAMRVLCTNPQRPRGGVVQDASHGVNAPASFSLAAIDYLPCSTEPPSYRICSAAKRVPPPCPALNDTPLTFDVGGPLKAGNRFNAGFVVRGANRTGLAYVTLYSFTEACSDQRGYSGNYGVLNPSGDTAQLQFDGHIGTENVRYLALDDQYLGGLPPVLTGDAGISEVESLVVCEYSYDESDSAL